MTEIKLKKGEPIERAIRRLKKKLDREQTLQQFRLRRRFEKPSAKKRRKEKAARFTAMLKARYPSVCPGGPPQKLAAVWADVSGECRRPNWSRAPGSAIGRCELGRPRQWRQLRSPTALSGYHRNLIYSTPPPAPGDAGIVLEKSFWSSCMVRKKGYLKRGRKLL